MNQFMLGMPSRRRRLTHASLLRWRTVRRHALPPCRKSAQIWLPGQRTPPRWQPCEQRRLLCSVACKNLVALRCSFLANGEKWYAECKLLGGGAWQGLPAAIVPCISDALLSSDSYSDQRKEFLSAASLLLLPVD